MEVRQCRKVRAGAASGSSAASVGCLVFGRPGRRRRHRCRCRRRHRPGVLSRGAVVVAAGAVRGAGARRALRHLRRPGEPHAAERPQDRAPRGRPSCVLQAGPKGRGHVSRRRTGAGRHRVGGRPEPAVERAERVSRHPARRPARHRAIEPGRRRRDPVRDTDGDGRPGRGAGGARLPAARRDRQLLRRAPRRRST